MSKRAFITRDREVVTIETVEDVEYRRVGHLFRMYWWDGRVWRWAEYSGLPWGLEQAWRELGRVVSFVRASSWRDKSWPVPLTPLLSVEKG